MPKAIKISKEQVAEIEAARKTARDKQVEKRWYAVQLRGEGLKNSEIASKLDTSPRVVSRWVSAFSKQGTSALMGGKYGGNRRNMSFEGEEAFLAEYKALAEKGQLVEVSAIKAAYEAKVGHSIGSGQI